MELDALLPAPIVQEISAFRDALNARCAGRIISLTLYGSAARGIFRAPASDLNLLIVVDRDDYDLLCEIGALASKSFSSARATPYLLTEPELRRAVDAFPTRFLEMKRGYVLLSGRDVLSGIDIDRAELVARTRQELLNLLMRFRHQVLSGNDPERLEAALRGHLPAFVKVLRTLVYLRTGEHVDDRERLIEIGAGLFCFPRDAFAQLMAWRRQEVSLQGPEWRQAARAFLDGLRAMVNKSDV